jgi:hypothetical protein
VGDNPAGRSCSKTVWPSASRMWTSMVLAARSTPHQKRCWPVSQRMSLVLAGDGPS